MCVHCRYQLLRYNWAILYIVGTYIQHATYWAVTWANSTADNWLRSKALVNDSGVALYKHKHPKNSNDMLKPVVLYHASIVQGKSGLYKHDPGLAKLWMAQHKKQLNQRCTDFKGIAGCTYLRIGDVIIIEPRCIKRYLRIHNIIKL